MNYNLGDASQIKIDGVRLTKMGSIDRAVPAHGTELVRMVQDAHAAVRARNEVGNGGARGDVAGVKTTTDSPFDY